VTDRVEIKKLPSGVPGLDDVLGGGLPEFSFNLIAGSPGSGKTTLAHQIMFASAGPKVPALYISIVGEPPLKMLRYQQQFSFFDMKKIPASIRYLNMEGDVLEGGLEKVLEVIEKEVETASPKLVFVDSFRSLIRKSVQPGHADLQYFVQRLSLLLTSREATTFLIGEYESPHSESDPVFTIADGIVWLSQATSRNSIVRQVQVVKMRGQGQIPGLHTVKISGAGLRVYPRMPNPDQPSGRPKVEGHERRKTGVEGLDEMLGGGIPSGYSVMVVGPSGTGKTILSTQFIREGIEHGEPGVIAVFEKRPEEYLTTAPTSQKLGDHVKEGKLKMLYLRPLDLSVDEMLEELASAVKSIDAKRVVIDSLSGFEIALAPNFREDFRESLYRLVGALTHLGVTVVMTAELVQSYTELRLSQHGISFLTDGIIVQQYVEDRGEMRKMLYVAKMRNLDHDKNFRFYEIHGKGMTMGDRLTDMQGILVGDVRRVPAEAKEP
jgi:circadian clock protein KaiC